MLQNQKRGSKSTLFSVDFVIGLLLLHDSFTLFVRERSNCRSFASESPFEYPRTDSDDVIYCIDLSEVKGGGIGLSAKLLQLILVAEGINVFVHFVEEVLERAIFFLHG